MFKRNRLANRRGNASTGQELSLGPWRLSAIEIFHFFSRGNDRTIRLEIPRKRDEVCRLVQKVPRLRKKERADRYAEDGSQMQLASPPPLMHSDLDKIRAR